MGNPRWHGGKESACQYRRLRFDPWVGKIPWGWKWQPTPVFLPGKFQGQRSLVGYSPRGPKSQTWLSIHTEKMWPFADRWEGDFYYFLSTVNQFRSLTHFESISGGQVFCRKIFQMAIYALQAFSRSWLDPTPGWWLDSILLEGCIIMKDHSFPSRPCEAYETGPIIEPYGKENFG